MKSVAVQYWNGEAWVPLNEPAKVRCQSCRHCTSDYILLPNGTYRIAVCERDFIDRVVVDAGVERECEYWETKGENEEETEAGYSL